jgi:hypothetical protein
MYRDKRKALIVDAFERMILNDIDHKTGSASDDDRKVESNTATGNDRAVDIADLVDRGIERGLHQDVEPALASAESIHRRMCRARRPCFESLQCRTMIEGSSDLFGDHRPTHNVCDTCAHQGVSADLFRRFRRQHDRQMGSSCVQRRRQLKL